LIKTGAVATCWPGDEAEGKPGAKGAYTNQRFILSELGKAHQEIARVSNRTWVIRPSGIIGGLRNRWPWWK
jgi:hypothetical protein